MIDLPQVPLGPPANEDAVPSYLELIGPAYRDNALVELAKISELSAGCYELLKHRRLNVVALATLTGALDASYRGWTSALAGLCPSRLARCAAARRSMT